MEHSLQLSHGKEYTIYIPNIVPHIVCFTQTNLALFQGELFSLLDTKIESIDTDMSTLEFNRWYSELLADESRNVLRGSNLIAGDYEATVTGIYGDDTEVCFFFIKHIIFL